MISAVCQYHSYIPGEQAFERSGGMTIKWLDSAVYEEEVQPSEGAADGTDDERGTKRVQQQHHQVSLGGATLCKPFVHTWG